MNCTNYEFTRKVKIEEGEDEEEIPTKVKDEDQDSVDEKLKKNEMCFYATSFM